ncbi:nuclear transport factor 2 family protein [Pedobacter mendelii]|uniref:SnoaL-like domain-containing protein n=1 Tax=Pedobacter mendelii TaxID=1908240 RepID=A0ABQ2BQ36_9SPHI|nr:nuclear transport factor 2 family protein [Pedobacter mendelii]GGI29531.1 hypothetical protein GCM10008119_38090 [Pedobacter mendelii]
MNSSELNDRILLKELVDNVSILADRKDFVNQVKLFTLNAVSKTYAGGKSVLKLQGREEMIAAVDSFFKNYETIYHFNGQQVLTINGNTANGTSYCMVTLIAMEQGEKMKTTIGAVYHDSFVWENSS